MSDTNSRPDSIHRRPGVLVLPNGMSKSKFKAGLLAGAAAVAIFAATLHSIRAETPQLKSATSMVARASANEQRSGFADIVALVKPAVVSVRVKADISPQLMSNDDEARPLRGTPFERFFREFRGKAMPGLRGHQPHEFVQGQGSGFFVSPDGYIVTNHHVVDKAVKVQVVTDNGSMLDAKVVGTDPKTDLALIKVESGTTFPFVELAGTTPRIGEWVIAMGNPFGLGGTVTAGIVSAHGRDIGAGPYDDFLQIDAPVNKGNSGGPTFNTKGEVVGVNTAIFSPSGGSVGIALAGQSSNSSLPGLGLAIAPAAQVEGAGDKGIAVLRVDPNSKAAEAGFQEGDVFLKAGKKELSRPEDLKAVMSEAKAAGRKNALVLMKRGSVTWYMAVPVA